MFTFPSLVNITIVLIPFVVFLLSTIYLAKTYILRREKLTKAATIVFIVVFLTVVFQIIASVGLQYYVWSQDGGIGEYLLPPHQPLSYFLGYSWQHFILSPVIGLAISFLIVLYFWILNRIFKKQYLDFEDMLILASGSMIVGWPGVVVYLSIAFVLTILRIIYLYYIKKEMQRVPMTAALIIAIFLTLLIGEKLIQIFQIGFLNV